MRAFALGLVLAAAAAPGLAQTVQTPGSEGWTFALSPYVWLPGVSTTIGADEGDIKVNSSASDAVADLDFAFMAAFEARKGRWGLILDLIYADLSSDVRTPLGLLYSKASVDTKTTAFTTYAAYRAVETPKASLDLLAGARFFDLEIGLALEPGILPRASTNLDDSWADPVVGLRGRYAFDAHWFATALGDYGGFGGGSDSTWQAFASVGYQFDPRWSVQGGWRYLAIERRINGQDVEVDLDGPLLGLTARF